MRGSTLHAGAHSTAHSPGAFTQGASPSKLMSQECIIVRYLESKSCCQSNEKTHLALLTASQHVEDKVRGSKSMREECGGAEETDLEANARRGLVRKWKDGERRWR